MFLRRTVCEIFCSYSIHYYKLFPKTRAHIHTGRLPATGPTDATINRSYLVCYRVDVLAYAHRNRFGLLLILSFCYYY